MPWHHGPMLGFDLETTGVDVETDRIVTAALVHIEPGSQPTLVELLADPGIPIPEGATAIHGITTEHAQTHGAPAHETVHQVINYLAQARQTGTPVVGMNLVYDLTLLDREATRHHYAMPDLGPVIDVLVLDKHLDPYRRGGRKLVDLAQRYQVALNGAHNSTQDALAALRIAWAIATRHPPIANMDLPELHQAQTAWAAEQRASFAAYRQRTGQPLPAAELDGTWPIRPARQTINT